MRNRIGGEVKLRRRNLGQVPRRLRSSTSSTSIASKVAACNPSRTLISPTAFTMANGYERRMTFTVAASLTNDRFRWSLLISIIFIAAFSAVSWFASPKGENQTYALNSSHGIALRFSRDIRCRDESARMLTLLFRTESGDPLSYYLLGAAGSCGVCNYHPNAPATSFTNNWNSNHLPRSMAPSHRPRTE